MSVAVPSPAAAVPGGRHRKPVTVAAQLGRAVDMTARLGSLVTLVSLMVLGATAGGVVDGSPAGDGTVTVTFDGSDR